MDKKIQTTYKPVRGFILAIPDISSNSSAWEISGKDTKPRTAKCVRIGEDTFFDHIDKVFLSPVKVGDVFLHSTMGHESITVDGEELILVPFDRVLAVKQT